MLETKKHHKNLENKLNEMELSNLLNKEFKMI